jgi:hypothetical protein
MRRTFVFAALVAGCVGLASASISLVAAPKAPGMCCGNTADCDTGKCCETEDGRPCDSSRPGYCAPACIYRAQS